MLCCRFAPAFARHLLLTFSGKSTSWFKGSNTPRGAVTPISSSLAESEVEARAAGAGAKAVAVARREARMASFIVCWV